jgi:hypothetical protein
VIAPGVRYLSLGKSVFLVFAIVIAIPAFLFTSRPTDCQALETVFRNSAVDGFSSFYDFIANSIVVQTHLVGLGWRQTVVYPNPELSRVFQKPTATEIAVHQSLFLNTSVHYELNIPMDELDTTLAQRHECAEKS